MRFRWRTRLHLCVKILGTLRAGDVFQLPVNCVLVGDVTLFFSESLVAFVASEKFFLRVRHQVRIIAGILWGDFLGARQTHLTPTLVN